MTPAELGKVVLAALQQVVKEQSLDSTVLPSEVTVERPRNPENGDYATTIALQSAKKLGTNPRQLATAVSYTHLTLPTKSDECRSRWSPYH